MAYNKMALVHWEIKNKKSGENVRINSMYYREKVLCLKFTEEIPFLYPNDFNRVKFY